MKSQLVKSDDPVLRQIAAPVLPGEDLRDVLNLLTGTCKRNKGVGIAAPQIGISKSIIYVMLSRRGSIKGSLLYNAKILEYSIFKIKSTESCLSLPGITRTIERYENVLVEYRNNPRALPIKEWFTGDNSIRLQHEIDHLNGKLIVDYPEAARSDGSAHTALMAFALLGIAYGN